MATARESTPEWLRRYWAFAQSPAGLAVIGGIAALGLAGVGVLDAVAARRREAPGYFAVFRPPQMLAAVVALLIVQVHRA